MRWWETFSAVFSLCTFTSFVLLKNTYEKKKTTSLHPIQNFNFNYTWEWDSTINIEWCVCKRQPTDHALYVFKNTHKMSVNNISHVDVLVGLYRQIRSHSLLKKTHYNPSVRLYSPNIFRFRLIAESRWRMKWKDSEMKFGQSL